MVQKYVSHTVLKKVHPYIFSRSLAIHLLENRVPIPHYRSKTWPFKYIYNNENISICEDRDTEKDCGKCVK